MVVDNMRNCMSIQQKVEALVNIVTIVMKWQNL